jgi:hypothetical protein
MGEQEICRAFRNTGHCRYGEECKFIHKEKEGCLLTLTEPARD